METKVAKIPTKDFCLIDLFCTKNYKSIREDLNYGEYFGDWNAELQDLNLHSLQNKAREHIIFLLMIFNRFQKTFSQSIDKFLFLDIMRLLPPGAFLHFNNEQIRYLDAKEIPFEYSTFIHCSIDCCHLCNGYFDYSVIKDSSIHWTCLEDSWFNSSKIENTTFDSVNLTRSMFSSASLKDVDFREIWMESITFKSYLFPKKINTIMNNCYFEACILVDASFEENIDMSDVDFKLCELDRANFGKGVFNDSCSMRSCTDSDIVIDVKNPNQGPRKEITWESEFGRPMWGFEMEAHLPYGPYSHW